jgi:hypothetical protein
VDFARQRLLSGFVMKQRCGSIDSATVYSYCLGLRPIYHGREAYELAGYRTNNVIITTCILQYGFFSWLGFPSDFTHTPLLFKLHYHDINAIYLELCWPMHVSVILSLPSPLWLDSSLIILSTSLHPKSSHFPCLPSSVASPPASPCPTF